MKNKNRRSFLAMWLGILALALSPFKTRSCDPVLPPVKPKSIWQNPEPKLTLKDFQDTKRAIQNGNGMVPRETLFSVKKV